MDGRRYLEQQIAEHFTREDGGTQLYVGREGLLPGLNAWPIPHNAPYKSAFDRVFQAVQEVSFAKRELVERNTDLPWPQGRVLIVTTQEE